jgi:glucosylceramidase
MEQYAAITDENDREMEGFSLARGNAYILPLLKAAQAAFGKTIPLMAAPWSPPVFMKTNDERSHGGELLPEYRAFYADYLCKYIAELRKEGAHIVRLTVQNEPKAVQTWDSCIYSALQEKEFIRDFLHPALQKHGLGDVEIFIWDHNKERVFERALEIMDGDTEKLVSGIAFHWYSGDHFEALDLLHDRFPDKKMVQSESCIEYSLFGADDFLVNAEKYAHEIIGDMNHGMTAFYDWNLVLDEKGGPNHVNNFCDAPFLFHTDSGKLEERASYAYIGHFSKYIRPGAKRIALSRYSEAVETTAFENPDGSIAAVFMNQGTEPLPVILRLNGKMTKFDLPGKSISTLMIQH